MMFNRYVQAFFLIISIASGIVQADSGVTPVTSASEISQPVSEAAPETKYTGEKISCNFQDTPIRTVLQIIADFSGTNMTISDAVTGDVTLHLDNVPWDRALDLILQSKGLDKKITNNVMLIAPIEEMKMREQLDKAREQLDLESQSKATSPATSTAPVIIPNPNQK